MTKPTVTDAMLGDAIRVYNRAYCTEDQVWDDAMRAAITAAIEASGWLELLAKADKVATSCEGLCDKTENLIKLADAACDYADAHCRAFPIATARKEGVFLAWDNFGGEWEILAAGNESFYHPERFTHWAPLPPPPTNPPLPAVFVELGAALEKIKGAG